MDNNELYHHGVKGMQWGKRLYQRQDGSLTPLGRARYAIKKNRADAKRKETLKVKRKTALAEQKALQAKYKKEAKDLKEASKPVNTKKKMSEMSDDELRRAIERARLEDTYKQLRPEETTKKGKGLIKTLMGDVVKPAAVNAGKHYLEGYLKKYADDAIEKAFPDPNSLAGLTKKRDKLKLKKEIEDLKKGKTNSEPEVKSWEDMVKKQTWEKNERERQREEAADSAAKSSKKESDSAAKSSKKESATADDYSSYDPASSAPHRSTPLSGIVVGEGTSRRSSSSNDRSTRSQGETFYTDNYEDISGTSVRSVVPSTRTTNFISGLLGPPRDRDD